MSARNSLGADPSTVPEAHILESADANAWLDGLLLYPQRFAEIPGGVVVIVNVRRRAAKLASMLVLLALVTILLDVFAFHLIGWAVNF